MTGKKNILFIYLNGHQRHYFRVLGQYLQTYYNIHYVRCSSLDVIKSLYRSDLPTDIQINSADIEKIIKFSLIKAQHRSFDLIRTMLYKRQALENQAYNAINYFYRYILEQDIDLVCVWNGTLIPLAAATKVAGLLGRKILYFENGYLPNTTTVDPKGVNSNNSLMGKPRAFYDSVEVDRRNLDRLYTSPMDIRPLKATWFQRMINVKPQGSNESIELPKRYIFLPFQVHDDTQVLLHSPLIKDMTQLTKVVFEAVQIHNRATGDALSIIAKEHPSDFGRVDYESLKREYQGKNIQFLRYYPTPDLIEQATGVVTLNSSVGVEALLQHKPVITLGNAFYNVPGLVCHVTDPANLAQAITWIDQEPDHQLIDRFLYYLRYHYLTEGNRRQPDENHLACVKSRIDNLLTAN